MEALTTSPYCVSTLTMDNWTIASGLVNSKIISAAAKEKVTQAKGEQAGATVGQGGAQDRDADGQRDGERHDL